MVIGNPPYVEYSQTKKVYQIVGYESENCGNLYAYVIMTNHMHTIMQSREGDLSGLVRDFKKFTSKAILKEVNENKQESRRECLPAAGRVTNGI